jgi:hypothetical protein
METGLPKDHPFMAALHENRLDKSRWMDEEDENIIAQILAEYAALKKRDGKLAGWFDVRPQHERGNMPGVKECVVYIHAHPKPEAGEVFYELLAHSRNRSLELDGLAYADIVQIRHLTVRKPEGDAVDDLGALEISDVPTAQMTDLTEPSSSGKQFERGDGLDEITILDSPPRRTRDISEDSEFTQSVKVEAKRQQDFLDSTYKERSRHDQPGSRGSRGKSRTRLPSSPDHKPKYRRSQRELHIPAFEPMTEKERTNVWYGISTTAPPDRTDFSRSMPVTPQRSNQPGPRFPMRPQHQRQQPAPFYRQNPAITKPKVTSSVGYRLWDFVKQYSLSCYANRQEDKQLIAEAVEKEIIRLNGLANNSSISIHPIGSAMHMLGLPTAGVDMLARNGPHSIGGIRNLIENLCRSLREGRVAIKPGSSFALRVNTSCELRVFRNVSSPSRR